MAPQELRRRAIARVERTCKGCGLTFTVKASRVTAGGGLYHSRACYDAHDPRRRVADAEGRFWRLVAPPAGPDACWMWTGRIDQGGYGYWQPHMRAPRQRAHRTAWELVYGSIPEGLWVLHTCDTPLCCNPAHLYTDDHRRNMRDMVERRRSGRGERHGASKLTWEDVRAVRARYVRGVYGYIRLARDYGVSAWLIKDIVRGFRWREWGDEDAG